MPTAMAGCLTGTTDCCIIQLRRRPAELDNEKQKNRFNRMEKIGLYYEIDTVTAPSFCGTASEK